MVQAVDINVRDIRADLVFKATRLITGQEKRSKDGTWGLCCESQGEEEKPSREGL